MQFTRDGIIFIRGDDDAIIVALTNGAIFETGDKVFFSLKTSPTDDNDILQIESETFITYNNLEDSAVLITIDHDDTIDMDHGVYYYDILIQWSNETYVTPIVPTKFTIVPGGSHGSI